MTTRQQIIDAARSYRGCAYHHQGRNRAGIDCAGLIVCVGRDVGIELRDMGGYPRTPDGKALRSFVEEQASRVTEYQPGDILLMRFERDPQHLAIVTDRGMIHSYLGAGKVTEHGIDATWAKRIVAAYAFPGVE
jgi:cell wall-associated NlpC family hydrolase